MPRWQRREIEKENQRARQAAKREYNDAGSVVVVVVDRGGGVSFFLLQEIGVRVHTLTASL
jgi:hypothetical protein